MYTKCLKNYINYITISCCLDVFVSNINSYIIWDAGTWLTTELKSLLILITYYLSNYKYCKYEYTNWYAHYEIVYYSYIITLFLFVLLTRNVTNNCITKICGRFYIAGMAPYLRELYVISCSYFVNIYVYVLYLFIAV